MSIMIYDNLDQHLLNPHIYNCNIELLISSLIKLIFFSLFFSPLHHFPHLAIFFLRIFPPSLG